MAVKYDVIMQDGRKLLMQGGCFGALNQGELSHWSLRADGNVNAARELIEQVNNGLPHSIMRFYPDLRQGGWPEAVRHVYWEDMQELVNTLPWLRDMVVVRPAGGFINFLSGENPGDKVILAVFMMRNIANMGTMSNAYRHARNEGLTPLQAVVACSVMWLGNPGLGGNRMAGTNYPGEYNLFNVYSFGRRSLERFVAGEVDWQLPSWQQLNGYRRDQYFWEEDMEMVNIRGRRGHRILLDAFSVPDDQPLFDSDNFNRDRYLANPDADEAWFLARCRELQRIWPQ